MFRHSVCCRGVIARAVLGLAIATALLLFLIRQPVIPKLRDVYAQERQQVSILESHGVSGKLKFRQNTSVLVPKSEPLHIHFDSKKILMPWNFSDTCRKYSIRFAQFGSLPLMALASFPGSGNTWLRYLIEGATGVFTGSVYNDHSLTKKGFYGEPANDSCGCTLVQKTHGYTIDNGQMEQPDWSWRRRMVARHGGRAVLLIRNPYEALLAYKNWEAGHIGYQKDNRFIGKNWNSWVRKKTNLWLSFNVDWLNMTSSVYVVHYENLRQDYVMDLRNILRFVGLPEDEDRLLCIQRHADGKFKRKPHRNQIFHHKDVFTASLHAVLNSAIETVQRELTTRGHPPLPLATYKYYKPSDGETTSHAK